VFVSRESLTECPEWDDLKQEIDLLVRAKLWTPQRSPGNDPTSEPVGWYIDGEGVLFHTREALTDD
jgi:hypothetical protein